MTPRIPFGITLRTAAAAALCAAWLGVGCRTIALPEVDHSAAGTASAKLAAAFPNAAGSLKFAVIGDFGTGSPAQYQLGTRMAELHSEFPYKLVLTVGDNIYGSERPQEFRRKFEEPYKAVLERGVKFYASLGNHDSREQRYYKLFNMDGKLYYSFKAPDEDVRFVALESTYLEPEQVTWLQAELKKSTEKWKIVYFHHPLYSSGGRHGSDERVRELLEPIFVEHGVSVVFAGHDHIYERVQPQHGITHFVVGSSGQLRPGDVRPNQPFSAKVVANTQAFLAAEIDGDELTFKTIGRNGAVLDSGVIRRRERPAATPGGAQ